MLIKTPGIQIWAFCTLGAGGDRNRWLHPGIRPISCNAPGSCHRRPHLRGSRQPAACQLLKPPSDRREGPARGTVPKRCRPCGDVSILVLRPLNTYRFRSQPDNDMLASAVGTQRMPLLADQTGSEGPAPTEYQARYSGAQDSRRESTGAQRVVSRLMLSSAVRLDCLNVPVLRLVVACRLRASCGGRPGLALGELSIVERRYRAVLDAVTRPVSSLGTSVSPMAGSFPVRVRWPLYHMETMKLMQNPGNNQFAYHYLAC